MKIRWLFIFLLFAALLGYIGFWYDPLKENQERSCKEVPPDRFDNRGSTGGATETNYPVVTRALLASRFNSLEELKSVIQVEYYKGSIRSDSASTENSMVRLRHCSNGIEVSSVLESGIRENDITDVANGGLWDRVWLVFNSPYAVISRMEMYKVFNLARRRPHLFGEGDVAFYDLAETSVKNINKSELTSRHPLDKEDIGYINSFNHITAQAFITTCFSEKLADFISDLHERNKMPELITGKFTKEQLTHPYNNPWDNYVDIINNEWGQEIGKKLKKKYNIVSETHWTPGLLANYLNDIQQYYSWAFQIGFKPFSPNDEVIVKFASKMNRVMNTKLIR